MRKIDEIERQDSCWNRARMEQSVFVLLDHDVAAPDTIRFWCAERVRKGKNTWSDEQIKSALADANAIEADLKTAAAEQAEKDRAVDQNQQVDVAQVNSEEVGTSTVVDAETPGEPIPDDPTGKELLDAIPPAANDGGANGLIEELEDGKKSDASTDDALGYDAGGRLE